MSRYRKVDPRIWNDQKFRSLSDSAKLVFFMLLTHPSMTALGAMRATMSGLAEELGWEPEAFREAFREAFLKGMVEHDPKAHFVALPNFLKYNPPESPNVIKAWPGALDLLPECHLKNVLIQRVKAFAEGLSKAFAEALPEAFAKSMPNQEQEQEQEQKVNLRGAYAPLVDSTVADLPESESDGRQQSGDPQQGAQATGGDRANPPAGSVADAATGIPDCPQREILAAYAEALPMLTQPRVWEGAREEALRTRWRHCAKSNGISRGYKTQADGVAFWRRYFAFVATSKTLTDGIRRADGSVWKPDLPWLLKAENFAKVVEGKYHAP